jgi:hypothetical protein
VLELRRVRCAAVRAFGVREPLPGAYRVAADEQLLLGARADELLAAAAAAPLAIDHSDGFAAFVLAGERVEEAFARLAEFPLPAERPAFVQGLVAHVGAKVVVRDAELLLLVPSALGHHVRARVLAACADLGVQEVDGARAAA